MAQASIPVDLFNPGQVFACLGLIEVADLMFEGVVGGFDWQDEERFFISADDVTNPVEGVLHFLANAELESEAPANSGMTTEKWGVRSDLIPDGDEFPIAVPGSPATLPAVLFCLSDDQLVRCEVNYWGDATRRDNVKFWAGAAGYPGAVLLKDALDLVRDCLPEVAADPFSVSRRQSSSFRLDWRRDYIPLDAGFSPNDQGNVVMMGYPIVEILAAIGLTHARPLRPSRSKLDYRYGVLGLSDSNELYDPVFLRAALGTTDLGFPMRNFRMQLGWPGQEGQARCITNVTEETRG